MVRFNGDLEKLIDCIHIKANKLLIYSPVLLGGGNGKHKNRKGNKELKEPK